MRKPLSRLNNAAALAKGALLLATLKDIALRVGVSVSTVSRVINSDSSRHVNAETKNKIWEAVRELGYEPNEAARRLVQNKTEQPKASMKIGCIVFAPQLQQHHPYFSPIMSGVHKELFDRGYSISYIHSQEEIRNEAVLHKAIHETPIDGMIIVGQIDTPILDYICKHIPAVVGIDTIACDQPIPMIDYDRIAAVQTAVQHLAAQGHRKIGFLGGLSGEREGEKERRLAGYHFALREAGLEANPSWIIDTRWNVTESYNGMLDMIDRQEGDLPTAMMAASDMMAIPAMRAAIERNLRIPEDMAFVGIDNIEISAFTTPPLSTVHIPKHEIGAVAATTLIHYIQNKGALPVNIQVPYKLIVRQSSRFARNDQTPQ